MTYNAASMRRAEAVKPRLSIDFEPTDKQQEFIADVLSGDWRFFGFGGAVRGGKSVGVLATIYILCKMYPGSKWAIVRKNLERIKQTVIPTIEKFAPRPFVGRYNQQTKIYRCANGSQIVLFPELIDSDPDLDRFKSFECNGFFLEEANELAEATFNKCKERMGSWIIQPTPENPNPRQPPAYIFTTFNPADNWVRGTFYDPWQNNTLRAPYHYLPALPTDNPYVTEEQWAAWRELPPEQYQRFIEGNWDAITDPRQLITYQQIIDAQYVEQQRGRLREGVDVASGGDSETGKHDDTVFCLIDGNVIDGAEPFLERVNGWSEPTIAMHAKDRIQRFGIHPSDYVIDSAPAGAYNILRRWGFPIRAFVAGAKAIARTIQPMSAVENPADLARGIHRAIPAPVASAFTFRNLRAQAWYEFAMDVRAGKWCILNPTKEMIRDLTAPRYDFKSEFMIEVSSREHIQEMTGHSPDVGSAMVMGALNWPRAAQVLSAGTSSFRQLR